MSMHEPAIVEELLAEVDRGVGAHGGTRAVHVVVSVTPGWLEEDMLRAAFEQAKGDTTAKEASLTIEYVTLDARCLGCGGTVRVADPAAFRCPACGSSGWKSTRPPSATVRSIEIGA